MGLVIDNYTYSTTSVPTTPSLQIVSESSSYYVELTTDPRPVEYSTQKIFTLATIGYPYLRPYVTYTVDAGFQGLTSNESGDIITTTVESVVSTYSISTFSTTRLTASSKFSYTENQTRTIDTSTFSTYVDMNIGELNEYAEEGMTNWSVTGSSSQTFNSYSYIAYQPRGDITIHDTELDEDLRFYWVYAGTWLTATDILTYTWRNYSSNTTEGKCTYVSNTTKTTAKTISVYLNVVFAENTTSLSSNWSLPAYSNTSVSHSFSEIFLDYTYYATYTYGDITSNKSWHPMDVGQTYMSVTSTGTLVELGVRASADLPTTTSVSTYSTHVTFDTNSMFTWNVSEYDTIARV